MGGSNCSLRTWESIPHDPISEDLVLYKQLYHYSIIWRCLVMPKQFYARLHLDLQLSTWSQSAPLTTPQCCFMTFILASHLPHYSSIRAVSPLPRPTTNNRTCPRVDFPVYLCLHAKRSVEDFTPVAVGRWRPDWVSMTSRVYDCFSWRESQFLAGWSRVPGERGGDIGQLSLGFALFVCLESGYLAFWEPASNRWLHVCVWG